MADTIVQPDSVSNWRHDFDALTSLRFVAATLVFLHHCEGNFGIPMKLFPFRRYAVSFFFVLSAFMLVCVYHNRKISWQDFYVTRISRLFPLHIIAFLATIACFWSINYQMIRIHAGNWMSSMLAQLCLIQCWNPDVQWVFIGNGVTWSLCVLLFFYAVFPLLLKLRRFSVPLLIVLIPASLWLLRIVSDLSNNLAGFYDPINVAHIYPPLRLVEFVFGMIVAGVYLRGVPRFLTHRVWIATAIELAILALIVWGWVEVERSAFRASRFYPSAGQVVLNEVGEPALTSLAAGDRDPSDLLVRKTIDGRWFYLDKSSYQYLWARWFRYVGFAIPAGLLILWLSVSKGWITRFLRHRFFVAMGIISYALFLIHFPLIHVLDRWLGDSGLPTALMVFICYAIVLAASAALYRWVEEPIRVAVKKRLRAKRLRAKRSLANPSTN